MQITMLTNSILAFVSKLILHLFRFVARLANGLDPTFARLLARSATVFTSPIAHRFCHCDHTARVVICIINIEPEATKLLLHLSSNGLVKIIKLFI